MAKAILFMGDHARLSPALERFAKPESIASIVAQRLRGRAQELLVVYAPRLAWGSMACYDGFVHALSPLGSPLSYDPRGLPAATATLSVLSSDKVVHVGIPDHDGREQRYILMGFSKGGIVLNQLLAELSYSTTRSADASSVDSTVPAAVTSAAASSAAVAAAAASSAAAAAASATGAAESFLRSIDEFHYVDVGLNDAGAYQTDPEVLNGVAKAAATRCKGLKLFMHGTPRQWMDPARPWIAAEKDLCVKLLREAGRKLAHDKLTIHERLYFPLMNVFTLNSLLRRACSEKNSMHSLPSRDSHSCTNVKNSILLLAGQREQRLAHRPDSYSDTSTLTARALASCSCCRCTAGKQPCSGRHCSLPHHCDDDRLIVIEKWQPATLSS